MKNNLFVQMVIQAIAIIQTEAANFVGTAKVGYDGVDDDLVTTADIKAQAFYQERLESLFPDEGIVGEEGLNKDSVTGGYFTIDPLDGTKAFGRKQSSGVGTMLAHVMPSGEIDMVCIGDVNTGEVYFFDRETMPTRLRFGKESELVSETGLAIDKTYAILREHPESFPQILQDMFRKKGGLFKDVNIESGSIGLKMARLWKGEVGVIALLPNHDTPWDNAPVVGMDIRLGMVHIAVHPDTLRVEIVNPWLPRQVEFRPHCELITRKEYVPAILEWLEEWKQTRVA